MPFHQEVSSCGKIQELPRLARRCPTNFTSLSRGWKWPNVKGIAEDVALDQLQGGPLDEWQRWAISLWERWVDCAKAAVKAAKRRITGKFRPVLRNKLFFFFDYNNSRIVQSTSVNTTVPLNSFRNGNVSYILNTDGSGNVCQATSRQNTTPQCIGTLTSAQVKALDPQGVGFNANLLAFVNQRYPQANDLTGGDGINTGGFRFTTPTPDFATIMWAESTTTLTLQ
jgi:hypothetical protein